MANNCKFPFLLDGIFCGIRYNSFPNYIMDLIDEFHIINPISVFFDFNITLIIGQHSLFIG